MLPPTRSVLSELIEQEPQRRQGLDVSSPCRRTLGVEGRLHVDSGFCYQFQTQDTNSYVDSGFLHALPRFSPKLVFC
jgi:hypothetical protein